MTGWCGTVSMALYQAAKIKVTLNLWITVENLPCPFSDLQSPFHGCGQRDLFNETPDVYVLN